MNRVRSAVDLAYTALAIGVILYTMRGEIKRILAEKQREIEDHTTRIRTRERLRRARDGWIAYAREHGIELSPDEIEVIIDA